MDRSTKQDVVAELKDVFISASIVIIGHNGGITVAQSNTLRRAIRAAGGSASVVKNNLAKIAISQSPYEHMIGMFKGPILMMHSLGDLVAIAKAVVNFTKENEKLKVVGAAMMEKSLDTNALKTLAELPSLEELRGIMIGLIQAPAGKLARVIQTPTQQIARVINAYATK